MATRTANALTASESVVTADLGDELVLLDVHSGTYFGVDPIGARIWQLIGQGRTEEEIVLDLLTEYEVEATVLRLDVRNFLELLLAKGLLRERDR